jgi:hypothetical protein
LEHVLRNKTLSHTTQRPLLYYVVCERVLLRSTVTRGPIDSTRLASGANRFNTIGHGHRWDRRNEVRTGAPSPPPLSKGPGTGIAIRWVCRPWG